MNALLEPLLASPLLPRHLEELNRHYADECAQRERFYEDMMDQKKVEFINGRIVRQPSWTVRHMDVVGRLLVLCKLHVDRNDLGWCGTGMLVALTRNDYDPDLFFYERGKADQFDPHQFKLPAPDFVVEVLSPDTEASDRGVKFEDYASHGIPEYWIIDPTACVVEQYVLNQDAPEPCYCQLGVWTGHTEVVSVAVPGFRLPAAALFDGEVSRAAMAALS